jgi:hypothetical protein
MFRKTPGVEYDVNKRWESGTPHHPKSLALMDRVKELDYDAIEGYFDFKTGGDGDNGEMLMYLLDIYFEENDAAANKGPIPGKCIC